MPGDRVFIDTNIILEAFRTDCWRSVCARFSVETVEKCVEEALTGDPLDPRLIAVDRRTLLDGLAARHAVEKRDVAELLLQYPQCDGLDDGERHLLAWLNRNRVSEALLLLSTADKAALVAAAQLGFLDSVVSLEQLASDSGVAGARIRALRDQYRKDRLAGIRTKIRLGVIP